MQIKIQTEIETKDDAYAVRVLINGSRIGRPLTAHTRSEALRIGSSLEIIAEEAYRNGYLNYVKQKGTTIEDQD